MIDTTFLPGITPITATWLNEANDTLVAIGTSTGASTIGCVPTGAVSATTVQGAIEQLAGATGYTDAQVRATPLTGLTMNGSANLTASDTVLSGFGKLKQGYENILSSMIGKGGGGITFRNTLNTVTTYLTNDATALRFYTFPDKDGTVAMTSDLPAGSTMVLLETATISTSVAAVNFLTTFNSTYNTYVIYVEGLKCSATTNVHLQLAVAGAALATTSYTGVLASGAVAASANQVVLTGALFANTDGAISEIVISNTASTTGHKSIRFRSEYIMSATPGWGGITGTVMCGALPAVTGFRILMQSGNLTGGTIRVYGIKNT